jgi:hypothetical protein
LDGSFPQNLEIKAPSLKFSGGREEEGVGAIAAIVIDWQVFDAIARIGLRLQAVQQVGKVAFSIINGDDGRNPWRKLAIVHNIYIVADALEF